MIIKTCLRKHRVISNCHLEVTSYLLYMIRVKVWISRVSLLLFSLYVGIKSEMVSGVCLQDQHKKETESKRLPQATTTKVCFTQMIFKLFLNSWSDNITSNIYSF